jgi:hypothetical protein
MRGMKRPTASTNYTPGLTADDVAETDTAVDTFELESQYLPGLGSGQILPVWLSVGLRRLFHRTDTHAAR